MFVIEALVDDRCWSRGIDLFWMPGPAILAARRQSHKEKRTVRVLACTFLDPATVLETIHYVPPAPRDVTALTKEIFG